MGNFEKLVVLTVLFLVATILGISMHDGEGDLTNDPTDPTGTTTIDKPADTDSSEKASGLLSGNVDVGQKPGVDTKNPARAEEAASKSEADTKLEAKEAVADAKPATGPKRILLTTEGLKKAIGSDEYMTYILEPGDSRIVVANRFYGDRKYRPMLQRDNEGVVFTPGTTILLAIYDFGAVAEKRETLKPAPRHDAPKAPVNKAPIKVKEYTVAEGDSLWSISFDNYGKGAQWGEIYKANRDRMSNENDLKVGMVLRIPAL